VTSDDAYTTVNDFLTAARLFDGGRPGLALGPEDPLLVLTTALTDAGARLDTSGIRDLIATNCTVTGVDHLLTDVAVELLHRFVVLTGVGR
jgi:hypothetical protein